MKPLSTSLLALALTGFAWGAQAADYKCNPVSGTVLIASETTGCTIANPPHNQHFPSVIFLATLGAAGTCFTGTFNGTWGAIPLTGASVSGLTLIANPPPSYSSNFVTAATVLTLTRTDKNKPVGTLYFLDTIHFTDSSGGAEEQLVVIEGVKNGNPLAVKGSLGIVGNEFVPPGAPVNGTLCLPD